MNNNLTIICATAVLLCAVGSSINAQTNHDITLKVSDDMGLALAGARATIQFLKVGGENTSSGLTDEHGEFRARTDMSLGTLLQAEKPGYYPANLDNTGDFDIPQGEAVVSFVLPRVLRPIPLYVLRTGHLRLPEKREWVGFDLAKGDWVAPHGEGEITDIRFKFESEFMGYVTDGPNLERSRVLSKAIAERGGRAYSEEEFKFSAGNWRGTLQVSFPRDNEGVLEETERYWYYNQLRLPHAAPEDGYKPSLRFEANTYEPRQPEKLVGYYMRTRVRLDEKGEIESANYAKIYGDIKFDARGTISFWYYYNPTPNDRNLEFDPSRNLFPRSMSGTNVANP